MDNHPSLGEEFIAPAVWWKMVSLLERLKKGTIVLVFCESMGIKENCTEPVLIKACLDSFKIYGNFFNISFAAKLGPTAEVACAIEVSDFSKILRSFV